jgi:NAD(P)H-quinone oxidoreductase subunit 6
VNLAEGVQIVSFGLLALMMIGSALGVVLFSNIVYSAFLLGAVFTSMAGMYLLLNADFVAAAQLLIYVGSVNVLILFAIMLVNKREDFAQVANTTLRKVLTAVVGLGLFALLGTMILSTPWPVKSGAIAGGASPVEAIGQHFFTDFLLPFELASVLLLIAMIGAIILARRDFYKDDVPSSKIRPMLTLPERSREPVGAISGTEKKS